jgi:hypothetical protein
MILLGKLFLVVWERITLRAGWAISHSWGNGGISNADEQDKRRWTRIRRLLLFHWRWNMPSIRFCRNGQPLKTTIYQFINNYLEIQAASV